MFFYIIYGIVRREEANSDGMFCKRIRTFGTVLVME